jgi:AcrR family transcriptional regulator
MNRRNSTIRQHILEVTSTLIRELGSEALRISEVAARANVGVPTIYYHFQSKTELIAEAQSSIYMRLLEPLHESLSRAETAASGGKQSAFWAAIGENMVMAWSAGQPDEDLAIVKLLIDVWSHPAAKREFRERLENQFDRWLKLIEQAKQRGWIDQDTDSRALIAAFWSATIGQMIIRESSLIDPTPENVRGFFLRAIEVRKGS